MRKLNKLISIILCAVMVLTLGFTGIVSADSDILFDLKSLGIIGGFGFEEHIDSNITRAEFAQLVVNMMNQKQVATTMESASYFNDIADSPYKGAINLLYKMEIISGTGEGTFEPERNVKYTEACKMLVKALGYHVIVSDTSLDSYTFLAGTIGVTANVDSSKEYITVRDMLVMVDNALDIGKMVPMYYNDDISPSYIIDDTDTFRNSFETPTPEGTVKMEGIVTADVSTYVDSERKSIKDTQLEISGKLFDFEGIAPLGLVGKHVYFYVQINDVGEYGNVVSISVSNKNTIINADATEIDKYSEDSISFLVNENKKYEIKTDYSTMWVYNGVPGEYCLDDVDMDGNVQVSAIDNNEDEIFDVVFVYEYLDAIVEATNEDNATVTFKTGNYYRNEKNVSFDEETEDFKVSYFDKDGNPAAFSSIKSGDVLSIAKSNDGKKIRIVISDVGGTALVESKDGDYVTLGSSEYLCSGVESTSLKVGRNYDYRVNFMNRLVWIDEVVVSSDYAYMYQISSNGGLDNPKVKLIIPEKVTSKTEQGEYNEESESSTSTTSLYIRNNNVLIYNMATKVTVEKWVFENGNEYLKRDKVSANSDTVNQMVGKPVSFEVDQNNAIIKISEVKASSTGASFTYNSTEKVFAKTDEAEPFGIDENTYAVVVPLNSDASEDDILNYIQELMHSKKYNVIPCDVDDESHIAKLIVYETEMISGVAGKVSPGRNNFGMVTKCIRVYNSDDGSESLKVTMLTKGNEKSVREQTFEVSPLIPNYSSFYDISAGDFITYSLDGFDRLDGYSMKRRFENYYDGDTGVITSEYTVCATVKDIDYDEISNRKGRWADVLTIENEDGTYTYELYHNSALCPTVFILNSANRSSKVGSISDIRYGDRVLVYANSGDAYAVIIYR